MTKSSPFQENIFLAETEVPSLPSKLDGQFVKIGNILLEAILKVNMENSRRRSRKKSTKYSRKLYKVANLCDRVSDSVWNNLGGGG